MYSQISDQAINLPEVVHAPRTDPIYNCHAYQTKVPVGAILPFIDEFTEPGDLVADPFAGSGMTGIAAAMRGRRAELSDISVLGRHIANGYLAQVDSKRFREAAAEAISVARAAIGDLYESRRENDGAIVEMIRTVWSFTYICPDCHAPLIFFTHIQERRQAESCSKCGHPFSKRAWVRGEDVPVLVVVDGVNGRQTEQLPSDVDLSSIRRALVDQRLCEFPSLPIQPDREMYNRSALAKHGLTETAKFFSPRNAIALLELWRAIGLTKDSKMQTKLRFVFTAILPRASRRYQWGPLRPLNAQNQTYYISPVYFEWNVFDLFNRKVEAAIRSDEQVFGGMPLFFQQVANSVVYTNTSADELGHLKTNSVDYIFTDPPFGSNIFYSDMSLFQEAWLGQTTDHSKEAVIHTIGSRRNAAAERYESLLRGAFREAFRVLKPGAYISVVFGNSRGSIWTLVQRAMRDSGFASVPVHAAILDKGQRSVKGLNSGSEGVVTVDLILTYQKPDDHSHSTSALSGDQYQTNELIASALNKLTDSQARNPSYVYVATVREAIQRHQTLDHLHLADVLVALRNAGYSVNPKTGLLDRPASALSL